MSFVPSTVRVHVIVSRDLIANTVVCQSCGEVPVSWRKAKSGTRYPACSIAVKAQRHARSECTNLTRSETQEFLANKVCEICGLDKVVVDHDHATGKIRGALCRACNCGLGLFHDDPMRLRAAAEYLER